MLQAQEIIYNDLNKPKVKRKVVLFEQSVQENNRLNSLIIYY